MERKLHRAVFAGVATLAVAAGVLVSAPAAFAAAPPWEPDSNSAAPYGRLVFYDASGNVLTGGTDLSHLSSYVAATTGKDAGATTATLFFALPNPGLATGAWSSAAGSGPSAFPNSSAPAPLTGPDFANPMVFLDSTQGDGDLGSFAATHPHPTADPSTYQDMYQVRIKDSGPGGVSSGSHYWEADVKITRDGSGNPTGWQLVDPTVTTTTTSITTTPANGGSTQTGNNVGLSATVTPGAGGTIQFFDGTTTVGSPHAVTAGSPTATDTSTSPAVGSHSYTAVFTPTGGTPVQGSTSPASTVNVTPPQTATSTALSINPSSTPQFGAADFTATVTESDSGTAGEAGSVTFTAVGPAPSTTSTTLGTVSGASPSGSSTQYVLHVGSVTLSQGDYKVKATFTPTSNSYAGSNSGDPSTPNFTVTASSCPGAPDPSGATCSTQANIDVTVNAGSLTITTPYTPSNVYHLPAMQLNASATRLESTARFPKAGDPDIIVHSSLAGDPTWTVSVTGSDLVSGSKSIDGSGLGLTGGTLDTTPAFGHPVVFADNASHDPSNPSDPNHGIKGGPWTFAHSTGGGNGSAGLFGTLTLYAPTSTQAGLYTGTITFSVA